MAPWFIPCRSSRREGKRGFLKPNQDFMPKNCMTWKMHADANDSFMSPWWSACMAFTRETRMFNTKYSQAIRTCKNVILQVHPLYCQPGAKDVHFSLRVHCYGESCHCNRWLFIKVSHWKVVFVIQRYISYPEMTLFVLTNGTASTPN